MFASLQPLNDWCLSTVFLVARRWQQLNLRVVMPITLFTWTWIVSGDSSVQKIYLARVHVVDPN